MYNYTICYWRVVVFVFKLTESMKDQTLATIDSNLVETGQFLEEIVSDPQKDKCLQTFVNSQEIIGWLKGFTTSKLNEYC